MKRLVAACLVPLLVAAAPAPAGNPQVDFAGFASLTDQVAPYRQQRLVDLKQFQTIAARPGALVLDARSADAFARGHIDGAVNLSLTDFTAGSLAAAIGSRDRLILIYCNNNFSNDQAPVRMKATALALNIQTFINLVDFNDPKVHGIKG